jgi:hypothetical protein
LQHQTVFFSYEGQTCEGNSLTNKIAASGCTLLQLTVKELRGKQYRQADVMLVAFLARTELHCYEHAVVSVGLESVLWAINICG